MKTQIEQAISQYEDAIIDTTTLLTIAAISLMNTPMSTPTEERIKESANKLETAQKNLEKAISDAIDAKE